MLSSDSHGKALELANDEQWQDVFFFLIDNLDTIQLSDLLLNPLIKLGGEVGLRIVAYSLSTTALQ